MAQGLELVEFGSEPEEYVGLVRAIREVRHSMERGLEREAKDDRRATGK